MKDIHVGDLVKATTKGRQIIGHVLGRLWNKTEPQLVVRGRDSTATVQARDVSHVLDVDAGEWAGVELGGEPCQ